MFDTEKTKILMMASAIYMGILGIAASFFPQEILARLSAPTDPVTVMAGQIIGALYLGLSALNWTARANIIGAIYSRPVALCNFAHFFIVGITLLKQWSVPTHTALFWTSVILNCFFASAFAYLMFFRGKKTSA